MIGWLTWIKLHGFKNSSFPPLITWSKSPRWSWSDAAGASESSFKLKQPINSFKAWSLWFSSDIWALRTEFSDSMFKNRCVTRFMFVRIWLFSALRLFIWTVRSPSSFCFLILDRLADSRFDSILFRFLTSVCRFWSSQFWRELDPELQVPLIGEAIFLCVCVCVFIYRYMYIYIYMFVCIDYVKT